jgi:hypothetical protein
LASIGVTRVGSLLDSLKGAANTLREADKIPQYQTVLDAYAQMSEMQRTIYDLEAKLREVTEELKQLQADQSSAEGRVVWLGLLWIPDDHDPYCVHCWDQRKRLFHVGKGRTNGVNTSVSVMRCPECHHETIPCPSKSRWQSNGRPGDWR